MCNSSTAWFSKMALRERTSYAPTWCKNTLIQTKHNNKPLYPLGLIYNENVALIFWAEQVNIQKPPFVFDLMLIKLSYFIEKDARNFFTGHTLWVLLISTFFQWKLTILKVEFEYVFDDISKIGNCRPSENRDILK